MAFELKSVFATEMYEYLAMLTNAEKDTESYVSMFKGFDEHLVKINQQEKILTDDAVHNWLKTQAISGNTRNYIIGRVRRFARYLAALGFPATEPDFCKATTDFIAYTFSDAEFAVIFDVADNGLANAVKSETAHAFPVLLRMLYGCGLRIGEALALQWEDIDLDKGIISIMEAKNDNQRLVPMDVSLTELLKQYRERRFPTYAGTDFLFVNEVTGKPYIKSTFRDWFLRVLKQANISNERKKHFERCISVHDLRHNFTFKSFLKAEAEGRLLEETAPCLSAYLGHGTFFSTEKYLTSDYTLYTDSQQRVSAAIDSLFPEVNFE
jgi:integrase